MQPDSQRNHGTLDSAELALSRRESIRRFHLPVQVRFLFVGESPPASGRFFYERNSGLYRAFLECFRTVIPTVTDDNFLYAFRLLGCYLVDLCPIPVDQLKSGQRKQLRFESEVSLHHTILELQPQKIASVMRAIRPNVERAASKAGWSGSILDLPYPGRWSSHRANFIAALQPELTQLITDGEALSSVLRIL